MSLNPPLNRILAEDVHRRMSSETFHHASRGIFWRAIGYGGGGGLAFLGLGGACWLAFAGYARIVDNTVAADRLAGAIKTAMETTTLKTEGLVGMREDAEVGLRGGALVGLKEGQTITIDNPVVTLDPRSRVNVRPDGPPVGVDQARSAARAENGAAIATNLTVFKTVGGVQGGQVDTGWKYKAGEKEPYEQYCYWARKGENNTNVKIDLGENGRFLSDDGGVGSNLIDRETAFRSCVWKR